MTDPKSVQERMAFLQRAVNALDNKTLFHLMMESYEGDINSLSEGLSSEELEAVATLALSDVDPILRGRGV